MADDVPYFTVLKKPETEIAISSSSPEIVRRLWNTFDWRLEELDPSQAALFALKNLNRRWSNVNDPERRAVWEEGWNESLRAFHAEGRLVAGFTHPTEQINVLGKYFKPSDPKFEVNYQSIMRELVLAEYFSDASTFLEFGSGTGINLLAAAQRLPTARIIGTDFVMPAIKLHKAIGKRYGFDIDSVLFDMRAPDDSITFPSGASVLTYGSLEQLGDNYAPFIDYLLYLQPKVVVHLETDSALLNLDNLPDYIADCYSRARGYPGNLLPTLRGLDSRGKITVLRAERSIAFPGLTPGNNLYVWKPRI